MKSRILILKLPIKYGGKSRRWNAGIKIVLSRAGAGIPIGPFDTQIAAQGLARNLTVVINNIIMSDTVFENVTEQVLSLSYDQTIILMGKMLEALKSKKREENYSEMANDISRSSMNTIWEELKNDAW